MGPGHPLAVESRTALAQLRQGGAGPLPVEPASLAPALPPSASAPVPPPAPVPPSAPVPPPAPVRASAPAPEPAAPAPEPVVARRGPGTEAVRTAAGSDLPTGPTPARTAWRPRITLLDEPEAGAPARLELRLEPAADGDPADRDAADPGRLPDLHLVAAVASDAVIDPPVTAYRPAGAPAAFTLTPAVAGRHPVRITVYDRGHGTALQDLEVVVDAAPARPATAVPGRSHEPGGRHEPSQDQDQE